MLFPVGKFENCPNFRRTLQEAGPYDMFLGAKKAHSLGCALKIFTLLSWLR